VDLRSTEARRFRDLCNALSGEYGGLAPLSEPEVALIRQAAALILQAEQLQAKIVKGESVDNDALIRIANTARRALAGLKRKVRAPKLDLQAYIAARGDAA
jgi:hypothetical protein